MRSSMAKHRCTRWYPWLLIAVLLSILPLGPMARADSEQWEFNLTPYFWAPDLDLNLQLGSSHLALNETFLQRDGMFKPNVGGVGFSAIRNHWVFSLEGEAMDADTDFPLEDERPGEFEFQMQRADFAVGYELNWSPYPDSIIYLTPFLGARYRHLSLALVDVDPPPETDKEGKPVKPVGDGKSTVSRGETHWFEPMAGLRGQWFITPKFSLAVAGDVDGFIQDQVSWNALGWFKFHWTKEFSISLGYRYNEFDFEGGSGRTAWAADGSAHGPMIGLELDFRGEPVAPDASWSGRIGTVPGDRLPEPPPEEFIDGSKPAEEDVPDDTLTPEEQNWLFKWLDNSHEYLNQKFDGGVEYADLLMSKKDAPMLEREKSRFFLELHTRFAEVNSGSSFELKPSVKVDAKVPNLKRDLKLFITNESVDQQRGTDVFDEDRGLNVGLETKGLFLKKTRFKVGVRSSFDAFVSGAWQPEWKHARWRILPEARVYYRTDRGAGTIFSCLGVYRIKDRFRAAYLPSIEYREQVGEWEWLQSLAWSYIFEGNEDDNHRAFVSRFAARGTVNQGALSYLWLPIYYRAPLYKKWIYWEVGPEVYWKKIDRWEPEPGIRFAISTLFWGTSER